MTASANQIYQRVAEITQGVRQQLVGITGGALDELVHSAVEHIPNIDYAGITVVSRQERTVSTPAATHAHPRSLDRIQQKYQEGPCLNAAVLHEAFFIDDLRLDSRWPDFQREALKETAISSIGSFQLFTTAEYVGALNLYADKPDAMTARSRELGYVYAAHTAMVWAASHRGDLFEIDLPSREVIGQATGMIMQREAFDATVATAYLQLLSQTRNESLTDIAREIIGQRNPEIR